MRTKLGGMPMIWRAAGLAAAMWLAWTGASASPALTAADGSGAAGIGAAQGPRDGEKQPGAVDIEELKRRLGDKGLAFGSALMVRIFKLEAELEIWIQKGERFELFAVYPVCNWSGHLGPKLSEGDRQSPEGFYSVGTRQLRRGGRWRKSLDIGFPNTYDKAHGRTGSYILVHGGCTSIGCYAMTDRGMDEIYALSEAALEKGQERIQVHVFPFRMTPDKLKAHAQGPWSGFWLSLKTGYDLFEQTRVPPQVRVCNDHYALGEVPGDGGGACVANISEPSVASARIRGIRHARRAQRSRRARIARRSVQVRHAQRSPGRNARQAYAAARASRMAAHGKAAHLGGPVRRK
jgi:murein L,D-transpeptidase YafK